MAGDTRVQVETAFQSESCALGSSSGQQRPGMQRPNPRTVRHDKAGSRYAVDTDSA